MVERMDASFSPEKIRVLYVDDECSLLEIGKKFLEKSGNFTVHPAESVEKAFVILHTEKIDAIISDFQMPTMDGIDFLKIVRARRPDLPFIFFSGRGGTETVIEAYRYGADLYLQKRGEPKYLFEDLRQTVTDIVTLRNTERALHESEQLFREVFNNANDAIFLHRMTPEGPGKYIKVNDVAIRWLGYTREELLTMSPQDIVPEPPRQGVIAAVMEKLAATGSATFESLHRRKDGSMYPVEVSTHIFTFKGIPVALSIVRDITLRRKNAAAIRESESRYRHVVEDQTELICRFAPDGTLTFVNDAYCRYFSLDRSLCLGRRHSIMLPEKDAILVRAHLAALTPENPVATILHQVYLPTGERRWHCWSDRAIFAGKPQVVEYQSVGRDVTNLIDLQEALRESEEKYRLLVTNLTDLVVKTDIRGRLLFVSKTYCELFGRKEDELIGKQFPLLSGTGVDVPVAPALAALLFPPHRSYLEERITLPSGVRWLGWANKAMLDLHGTVIAIVGVGRDITEKKQAEDALLQSEQRLSDIIDHLPDATLAIDRSGTVIAWNRAIEEMTGVKKDAMVGRGDHACAVPFYGKKRPILIDSILNPDVVIDSREYQNIKKCGKVIYAETTCVVNGRSVVLWGKASPLYNVNGEQVGAIESIRDVTERKLAEDTLQETNEYLQKLIDYGNAPIVVWDQDFCVTRFNHAFEKLTGLTEQEVIGQPVELFLPDDMREAGKALIRKTLAGERWEAVDIPITAADGTTHTLLWNSVNILTSGAELVSTVAQGIDITRRKEAEDALAASEQKYIDLVKQIPDIIFRLDPEGTLTYCSPSVTAMLGYDPEEIVGRRLSDLLLSEDSEEFSRRFHDTILTNRPFSGFEIRVPTVNKEMRDAEIHGVPIFSESGTLFRWQGVLRDITDRRTAENQVREYQETLEQRVRDRTAELSATNLKLKKEIDDRIKVQKKLTISATEKDLLLREVHHRVKNNLQLIIGLIDMTKTRAHEPAVVSTLTDIMAKVQTMGIVHTRLYESKRFDRVNMKQQVQDLVTMISGFYDHEHHDITTNIDCADIYLPVDLAIPCALAMNEIVSNIHKHAFRGRRTGLIEISSAVNGDQIRFIVRDNGVGLPSGFDIEKSNRLGLKLMRTLVEQQLHGNVQITSRNGTEVVIEFCIRQGEEHGTGTGS